MLLRFLLMHFLLLKLLPLISALPRGHWNTLRRVAGDKIPRCFTGKMRKQEEEEDWKRKKRKKRKSHDPNISYAFAVRLFN